MSVEFKVGDLVVCKCGGPVIVIGRLNEGGETAFCVWWDEVDRAFKAHAEMSKAILEPYKTTD